MFIKNGKDSNMFNLVILIPYFM